MENLSLHEIGCKCGTDKANNPHFWEGQNYLHIYSQYMEKLRDKPIRLLEIGVRGGNSLHMWEQYFPNAKIVGIDLNPGCANKGGDNSEVIIGNQTDFCVLRKAVDALDGTIDIVVDDGSHLNELTLVTWSKLWQYVTSGGLYIFEDMQTSYEFEIVAAMKRGGWYHDYVHPDTKNVRRIVDKFLLEKIRNLDYKSGDIRAIHMHCMTYIMEKI